MGHRVWNWSVWLFVPVDHRENIYIGRSNWPWKSEEPGSLLHNCGGERISSGSGDSRFPTQWSQGSGNGSELVNLVSEAWRLRVWVTYWQATSEVLTGEREVIVEEMVDSDCGLRISCIKGTATCCTNSPLISHFLETGINLPLKWQMTKNNDRSKLCQECRIGM
jgi:hypothetical protein